MDEKMAAYHECAHAVANFLVGIHICCICAERTEYGPSHKKQWEGICRPADERQHKKLQITSDLAGMFGAQLGEGKEELAIPSSPVEFAHYGAYGGSESDWNEAQEKCGNLIIDHRFPDWIDEEPNDPALKDKYDKQTQQGDALRDILFDSMLHFVRDLVSENRAHVTSLGNHLLAQPLQELEGPINCIDKDSGTKRFVKRLSGEQVKCFLEKRGVVFSSYRQVVEAIAYPSRPI